jgi:excisionase family DNA binding protein
LAELFSSMDASRRQTFPVTRSPFLGVAIVLGVGVSTVRRMVADGRLPAVQLGPPGSTVRVRYSARDALASDVEER